MIINGNTHARYSTKKKAVTFTTDVQSLTVRALKYISRYQNIRKDFCYSREETQTSLSSQRTKYFKL